MAKVTVQVTQADIDDGLQGDCRKCPIALALRRLFPGVYWLDVTRFSAVFERRNGPLGYMTRLPVVAAQFTEDFDLQKPVDPLTFILNVPDELLATTGATP